MLNSCTNYNNKIKILRSFFYQNTHQIKLSFEKINIFYTFQKDISFRTTIRIFSLLELITNQKPYLIRSKKSSAFFKIRKGFPLGCLVTLQKFSFFCFSILLIWEILPFLKRRSFIFKKNKDPIFTFLVKDPLIFEILQKYYFIFRNFTNLRISFSFSGSRFLFLLNKRLLLLPF